MPIHVQITIKTSIKQQGSSFENWQMKLKRERPTKQ